MIYKKERGQALVEFAIVLPVLLLIVTGIIEFGLILNSYLSIQHATREGARSGSVGDTDTQIQNIVLSNLSHLDITKLTLTVVPAYSLRSRGESITVNVTYDYQTIIPLIGDVINDNVVLEAETVMRVE